MIPAESGAAGGFGNDGSARSGSTAAVEDSLLPPQGIELREVVGMPANNLSLVFVKVSSAVPA